MNQQLTELRMAYFREVYPPDTDFGLLEELTLAGFDQGRARATYVERDGKLVSMCLMSLMDKMPNARIPNGSVGEIYGVYTLPEYRGRGYATACVSEMLQVADELGLELIQLEASPMGRPVYEALGFKTDRMGYVTLKLEKETAHEVPRTRGKTQRHRQAHRAQS